MRDKSCQMNLLMLFNFVKSEGVEPWSSIYMVLNVEIYVKQLNNLPSLSHLSFSTISSEQFKKKLR